MALLSGFDQIDPANDSFSDWLQKTNEMLLIIRGNTVPGTTQAMTANSLPGGSMTWGNATLFGQFTANTMVVLNDGGNDGSDDNVFANGSFGGLRGGNWDPATNNISADTLYVVSNTTFTDEGNVVYVDTMYGLQVEANTELRHDVLFVGNGGTAVNPKLKWEDADNILSFNDNVRAVFGKDSGSEVVGGTGQAEFLFVDADSRMYVNTENMNIRANTDVNFITDNFELKSDIGSELYISADVADNSTVKLYYEGNLRLSTNTHGVVVDGDTIIKDDIVMFDTGRIMMGGTYPYDGTQDIATYNFQIYTDGTDGIIVSGDKDLNIFVHEGFNLTNEPGTINFITANNDGSSEVVLYNNGDARLETTGTQLGEVPGVEVFGEANTTTLRVREDANFDGFGGLNSNNVHWDASANTWNYRDATKITLGDSDDWEMFYTAAGRAYSNTDNQDIRARVDLNIISDIVEIKSELGSELYMSADVADNSTVKLYYEGNVRLSTNTHGIVVDGDTIVKDNVVVFDNNKILMGGTYPYTGAEDIADYNFQIYTDGTDGIIVSGDKDLNIFVHEGFNLTNEPGTISFITANNDGSSEVVLYNGGVARLETTGTQLGEVPGVEIHGEANTDTLRVTEDANFDGSGGLDSNNVHWDASANTWNYRDATKITLGDSDDWEMFYLAAGRAYSNTDNMDIRARTDMNMITDTFELKSESGAELYMSANVADNSTVRLYYEGSERLQTNTHGVEVTGELVANGGIVTYNDQPIEMGGANYAAAHNFTIVTDGTDTTITETANDLFVRVQDNFRVTDDTGVTSLIVANTSGEVTLYHNNNQKLQTNNYGIEVTGEANTGTLRVRTDANFDGTDANGDILLDSNNMSWDGSANTLYLKDSSPIVIGDGGDLSIYHDGTNSYIEEANTGSLIIEGTNLVLRATDDSRYLEGIDGTGTRLYSPDDTIALVANNNQIHITDLANTSTLRVRSTSLFEGSIDIEGSTSVNTLTWTKSSNTLNFDDDNFATFGTGGDLSVYHDANNSYIENITGELYIQGDGITIRSHTGTEEFITADVGGAVTLYWDDAIKLQTNTNGIEVTGQVIASTGFVTYNDQKIEMGGTNYADAHIFEIYTDGSNSYITETGGGDLNVQANNLILEATDGTDYFVATSGANTTIHHGDGTQILEIRTDGVDIEGEANTDTLRVQGNAKFEGTDDTIYLEWLAGTKVLDFNDDVKARFGDNHDLEIYSDGSISHILESGSGNLVIEGTNLTLRATDDTNYMAATDGGSVQLYYAGEGANNIVRVSTTNLGVDIEGEANTDTLKVQGDAAFQNGGNDEINWEATNNILNFNDGVKATFGTDDDLEIYFDATGNNSIIRETGGGDLYLQANGMILEDTSGNNYVDMVAGGAVSLYHNGATKLATKSTGVGVTGQLDVSTNIVADGNLTVKGNTTLGDANTDTIDAVAEFVSNLIPEANTTYNIGSSDNKWNDLHLDGAMNSGSIQTGIIAGGNTTITGDVDATTFTGNGAAITNLNASNIDAGTIGDDYLPDEISSDITGTAAQANTVEIHTSTDDQEFRVAFTANTADYHDIYADSGLLYNPVDKILYADNLTVNTNITLPSEVTLALANVTDLEVSNTATILNLEVTSLEANGVAFTGTGGDVTSNVATLIDTFPIEQTRGFKYFVHGEVTNDDTKGYAVEINVITTDTGADTKIFYTRYGEVESGMADVNLVPQLAANNTHIDLMATCDSATATDIHRFNVLKIETRDNGV